MEGADIKAVGDEHELVRTAKEDTNNPLNVESSSEHDDVQGEIGKFLSSANCKGLFDQLHCVAFTLGQ